MTLPQGWTLDEESEVLPQGWTLDEEPVDARKEAAGQYYTPEKTPEELKKMSVQERMEYAQDINREREYLTSKGFTKGALSGLSFGASEYIPGLDIQEEDLGVGAGKFSGSLLPISKIMNVFGGAATKLASKSPVFQKQLTSLANILSAGATGATVKGIESAVKGEEISPDELLEHGAEWSILDAGLRTLGSTAKFAYALARGAKNLGTSEQKLLNESLQGLKGSSSNTEEFANKVLQAVEDKAGIVSPESLKNRKISQQAVKTLESDSVALSEPVAPGRPNYTREAESLERGAIERRIESTAPRAASEQEIGAAIREDIEANLEASRNQYRPLYESVEQSSEHISHIPQNTAREAGDRLTEISSVRTRPSGYNSVINSLETVLQDAGFQVQRDARGAIESIISAEQVPVRRTIELARRLNEMVDYEAIEPTVKNVLRRVARAAKADVRAGLAAEPEALRAFETAERAHAESAQRFGRDTIRRARQTESGEKVAKLIDSPTALQDLRAVVSPVQMNQIEREILEKLNTQSFEKSQKTLRNIQSQLSEQNRRLARDIVEAKNPHNPEVRRRLVQESVLDDLSNSFTDGTRPDKTLKLWKTPKGRRVVRDTFEGSPNWPEVKTYLEKQTFNDVVTSVMNKEGTIDPKKLKSLLSDSQLVKDIQEQGGQDAVRFFRSMDGKLKQLEKNAKTLNIGKESLSTQRARVKDAKDSVQGKKILNRMVSADYPLQAKVNDWTAWVKESLNLDAQAAMTVFGIAKLGGATLGALTVGIPGTVTSMIGYRIMNKLLTSPKVRKAFIELSKPQNNPIELVLALKKFGELVQQENDSK